MTGHTAHSGLVLYGNACVGYLVHPTRSLSRYNSVSVMTFFDDNEHPNATRTFPCLKYLRRTRSMAVLLAPNIHLFEQVICASRWCRADHTSVLHNGDLSRNSLRRSPKRVHDKSTNNVISQYKHGLNNSSITALRT